MMKAIFALDRIRKNLPIDNKAWTDEDRDYIITIIHALEAQAERESN